MFEIVNRQILSEDIKRISVLAKDIASRAKPGQFVAVCPEEGDERIPLTIVDSDPSKGTITLIFHEKGQTTLKLGSLPIKENIYSIVGPLGKPSTVEKKGTVICIATGVGIAQMLPIARAYRNIGNKVIGIIGAKSKRRLMLEPQMRICCNKLYIATEDGSYERKGLATDILKKMINEETVNMVYAIGAVEMMENVCAFTKEKKIKTFVQLNPIMVDCMGMCGSCRVKVSGKMVHACIEGPEFDGHKVDFNEFKLRSNSLEELDEWYSQKSQLSTPIKEPGILTRFLWGSQKEQP
ncbi:MAG: sulfide/dihydroorotate dehydrogenase-like FAD/NAD-binding protein [Candidatus Omnitrophica bacterium]|nr:sulfide/dihydroorotate dehydrogenase-like FAD/NAD-binding protein [Candidatus Omnitrophota bacterium]